MRRVILILWLSIQFASAPSFAQSPHGKGLNLDCSECHAPTSWKVDPANIKFNHDETSFRLTGQHTALSCRACHSTLIFSAAKSTCNSCHNDVHRQSLGNDCGSCHTTSTWVIADVSRLHRLTRFPLVGAHQNVDCESCHSGYSQLYFPPISVACITCHSTQYYATTSPNHAEAGFSTNCQDCHGIAGIDWTAQNFNHSFFPLTGGHAIQNCSLCHAPGSSFKGLSTTCYSCHSTDFANTTNPNHAAGGFPHDCSQCHTITVWTTATFDHSKTAFPLTGAHTSVQCATCHGTDYSGGLPTNCYGCHKTDYQNTTNPAHATAGFPTDCAQCHTESGWSPSTFDHTSYFPLTGSHNVSCTSCHINSSSFADFSCTAACHSQSNTDSHHSGVSGYVYSPTSCYGCHKNGGSGD